MARLCRQPFAVSWLQLTDFHVCERLHGVKRPAVFAAGGRGRKFLARRGRGSNIGTRFTCRRACIRLFDVPRWWGVARPAHHFSPVNNMATSKTTRYPPFSYLVNKCSAFVGAARSVNNVALLKRNFAHPIRRVSPAHGSSRALQPLQCLLAASSGTRIARASLINRLAKSWEGPPREIVFVRGRGYEIGESKRCGHPIAIRLGYPLRSYLKTVLCTMR